MNRTSMHTLTVALVLSGSLSAAQTPPADLKSQCVVSDDPRYAVSKERPVQVGGGAMFVAARERRYLDALRGPAGQPVRYRRTGTTEIGPEPVTVVDIYEVTYEGLDKPVILYLDAYHFDDALRAPAGFTCGRPIGLNPPAPDGFLAMADVAALAVERGAAREYDPIPLVPDATSARGVALDHFRVAARHVRAAAAAGRPLALDPAKPSPEVLRPRSVVVAYPVACDGGTVAPRTIDMLSAQGAPAPRLGEYASGAAIDALVPGLDAPEGSLAAAFNLQAPRANDSVKITYAEPCGASAETLLPVRVTPARLLTSPMPTLPAGAQAPPGPVRLQAQIDLDGTFQRLSYIGGPQELVEPAMLAVKGWTVEPTRVNGAAISTPVTLTVTFAAPKNP